MRPPFPTEWIEERYLQPGPLDGMNADARGIFLADIETGASLGELCNLLPERIVLDHSIPYIRLGPSLHVDERASGSLRAVPLVGVALAVFRAQPDGFARYRGKATSLSAAVNKYLRENGLLPTRLHTVSCLRRTFEARMIEAGLDGEVRRALMGYRRERPSSADAVSLLSKQQRLLEMALPFDASIV